MSRHPGTDHAWSGLKRRVINLLMLSSLLPFPAWPADPAVTVAAVPGEWRPTSRALAQVSAREQAQLSLPFTARILSLPVEPGVQVQAGQILATFDAPQLRRHLAEWELARRDLALAQQKLAVLQQNRREKTITRRDLLDGQQATARAEARADRAWQALATELTLLNLDPNASSLAARLDAGGVSELARELGQLKAPFAGLVTVRRAALGEQLATGTEILELESLDPVYLDVGVPEALLSQWRQGRSWLQRNQERLPIRPLQGLPRLDRDSGLWLLRFEAQNPGHRLRDGLWTEVQHLGAPQPVAWVPKAAVVARNGKQWVVASDGKGFKPVQVQVGTLAADGRIPVIEGLPPGTRVMAEGAYELLYRDLTDLIKFVD